MDLIVAKFGGTSVGDGSRIKKAAQSVVNEYMKGKQVVVVVSALSEVVPQPAIVISIVKAQKADIILFFIYFCPFVFCLYDYSIYQVKKQV